jgi:hypothetical protein
VSEVLGVRAGTARLAPVEVVNPGDLAGVEREVEYCGVLVDAVRVGKAMSPSCRCQRRTICAGVRQFPGDRLDRRVVQHRAGAER